MDKDSVLKLLENVAAPIIRIEEKIGMPRSTLQKAIDGDRPLPKEWAIKLKDFVEKKQYIGLKRKKPELKFAKSGAKKKEPSLDTKIDYKEPDEAAYDGKKADKYLNDEYGQTGKMEKKPYMSDAIKKKLGL